MNDLNLVTVTGHSGTDAEVREAGEHRIARFRLAVGRKWKAANGDEREAVDWFDVEAWDGLSKIAEEFVKKGRKVLVHGSLRQDQWEKNGQKRSRVLIIARHLDVRIPQPGLV